MPAVHWIAALLSGVHAHAVAPAAQGVALSIEEIASPAARGSRCPRLTVSSDGAAYLSWTETDEAVKPASTALRFSRLEGSQWSAPREIARGADWFVNWADFPALAVLEGEHLVAHFLQKRGQGTYDYDVRFTHSQDGGAKWAAPQRLHSHDGAGEHGFVSLTPHSATGLTAVWLDGRNTQAGPEHAAEMALCARTIGQDGTLGNETVVDARVCDCCPTSAVTLPDGAVLVAYRDRSADEVRDIAVVRIEGGQVSPTSYDTRDGWKVAGCPVNGPVLAVRGENVALAWFTFGSEMRARVVCAFSKDGGRSFGPPVQVAGTRAHGRVDAAFDNDGRLLVTWLEADVAGAEWRIARVDLKGRVLDQDYVVATKSSRESGLARLAVTKDATLFAWTKTQPETRVAVSRLTWK